MFGIVQENNAKFGMENIGMIFNLIVGQLGSLGMNKSLNIELLNVNEVLLVLLRMLRRLYKWLSD